MIEMSRGDLLQAPVEALVNTVNCVGVMGKGIALQFARAFPENTKLYKALCKKGELRPGEIFTTEVPLELETQLPHFIINFATKDHWKAPSQLAWIESGLRLLRAEVETRGISSIAIPPLGCGNGGLSWSVVRSLIESAFEDLTDVRVLLFAPDGAPDATTMAATSKAPNMSHIAALTIELLEGYNLLDLEFSQLEIQKLTYLLNAAGEPMPRLKFEKQRYGPAARPIFNQLSTWEQHWIIGFGDGSGGARAPMLLKPEAIEQAHQYRNSHPNPQSTKHVERVFELIEGLETALGLELLATVHWAARHHPQAARDLEQAVKYVHSWNSHKAAAFSGEHIALAWNRLSDKGWLQNLRPEWMRSFDVEEEQVEALTCWISERPELEKFLPEVAQAAKKFFSDAKYHLELWHDPETMRDELSMQIQSTLSPKLRTAHMERLDHEWWLERAALWQGVLSIELI